MHGARYMHSAFRGEGQGYTLQQQARTLCLPVLVLYHPGGVGLSPLSSRTTLSSPVGKRKTASHWASSYHLILIFMVIHYDVTITFAPPSSSCHCPSPLLRPNTIHFQWLISHHPAPSSGFAAQTRRESKDTITDVPSSSCQPLLT